MWFPGALEQDRITLSLTEMVWSPPCMNSKNFCFPTLDSSDGIGRLCTQFCVKRSWVSCQGEQGNGAAANSIDPRHSQWEFDLESVMTTCPSTCTAFRRVWHQRLTCCLLYVRTYMHMNDRQMHLIQVDPDASSPNIGIQPSGDFSRTFANFTYRELSCVELWYACMCMHSE